MAVARLGSLRALRNPSYLRIWLGALTSNIGTWMETLALGVWVTEATGKALWTGSVVVFTHAPVMALSALGGALADRFDRRRYLMGVTLFQTAVASTLAALAYSRRLNLPAAAVLAVLTGCGKALADSAYTALLADAVPEEDLFSARVLSTAQFNLGRILGPMLGAGLIATGGTSWAFAANALSFLPVLAALSGLSTLALPQAGEGFTASIVSGIRACRDDAGIRALLWMGFFASLLISPFIGLAPAFAIQVFQGGSAEAGMLSMAQGMGALASAVVVGELIHRSSARRIIQVSSLLIGPMAILYWVAPWYRAALGLMVVLGAIYVGVLTPARTTLLARAPRELQARVASLFNVVISAGYSLGLLAQGALGDRFGLRWTSAAAGGLFAVLALRHQGRLTAIEDSHAEPPLDLPPEC